MTGPSQQFGEFASTRLSTEAWRLVKRLADHEKRTVASMIRILIDEALNHRRNGKARTK